MVLAVALGLLRSGVQRGLRRGQPRRRHQHLDHPGQRHREATASGPKPRPPVLELVAAAHPGITVSWSEPTPCDTVEGERQTMIDPYPSEGTPSNAPPAFSVPGSATSYVDRSPSQAILHSYHVRCVTAGVASDWSNEFAANPAK